MIEFDLNDELDFNKQRKRMGKKRRVYNAEERESLKAVRKKEKQQLSINSYVNY